MEKQTDRPTEGPGAPPETEPTYAPQLLDGFMQRHTASVGAGGKAPELTKDTVTIVIRPHHCSRGAHPEPFRLTLVELNSRQELIAMRESGMQLGRDGNVKSMGGPESMILALGKAAVRDFNGRKMTDDEKLMVWESLKLPARMACGKVYGEHLAGLEVGLGEILNSVEIG